MSLPTSYASILNDLNRDVLRARPTDPLQFCANWFNKRLEEQRQGWLSNNPSALSQQQHALLGGVRQGEISAINVAAPSPFTQSAPSSSPFANSSDAPPASTGGASPTQTSLFTTPAPFNSGNSYPGVPLSAGMTGLSSDDDTGASPDPSEDDDAAPFIPPSFNLGRRTSVAAESIKLSAKSAPLKKTVIPKTEEQLQNIRASIGNNLLFRNLEEDQHRDVLLAMKEVKVDAGVAVIEQGAQGDYFYVVQSGSLDVYVRAAGTASSQSSDDGRGPSSSLAALGDKKVSYGPGASFGELALLYAQPRAATVLSTSPCTLWALDRITFRSILMETNSRRRNMYENFLKEVSLFEHLSASELAKISDALELRTYEIGQEVIKQGESGTEFYIIVEGHAEVIKARDGTKETVGKLTKGDYFGGE